MVDIELQVVAGLLMGKKVPLGDGVDRNDKPFLSTFPYLAGPATGLRLEALEPVRAGARAGSGQGARNTESPVQGAPPGPPPSAAEVPPTMSTSRDPISSRSSPRSPCSARCSPVSRR